MTTMVDVKYGAMETIEIPAQERAELEAEYGVSLGKHVRQIRGMFGPVTLFFHSKIGLGRPLRGREWAITYSSEYGPGGKGLEAIRPGADKPLADEEYTHLYNAWYQDKWRGAQLHLLHDGQLYAVQSIGYPTENWLYLMKVEPVADLL